VHHRSSHAAVKTIDSLGAYIYVQYIQTHTPSGDEVVKIIVLEQKLANAESSDVMLHGFRIEFPI
jgi:hypothetical protein